jgi:hypothetical protein
MRSPLARVLGAVIVLAGCWMLATDSASAGFSAALTVRAPSRFVEVPWRVQVATDESGRSIVVWAEWNGPRNYVEARWVEPTGEMGPPVNVSSDSAVTPIPQVVARHGRAFVAWLSEDPGSAALSIKGRWLEANGSMTREAELLTGSWPG